MATSKQKFEGWSFEFEEDETRASTAPETPGSARRGRRGGPTSSSKLILKREEDGFTIRSGDCLVVNDPDEDGRVIVMVKKATIGTANYVDLIGLGFLGLDEVSNPPNGTYEQEIFLTSVGLNIAVENVIEKATVLTEADFKKTTIDNSNKDDTFICRKGYDTYYETYSADFNIKTVVKNMRADPDEEEQRLKDLIVKPPYKQKKEYTPKEVKVKKEVKTEPSSSRSTKKTTKKSPPSSGRGRRRGMAEVVVDISDDSDSDVVMVSAEEFNSDDNNEGSDSDDFDELFADDDEFNPRRHKMEKTTRKSKGVRPRKCQKQSKGPKSLIFAKKEVNGKTSDEKEVTLVGREEQFTQLHALIEPAIELENGAAIFISGTPGTGKTFTVREVVKQLWKQTKDGSLNKFDYFEINGLKLITPTDAYSALWSKVNPDQKPPTSQLSTQLEEYFQNQKSDKPLVLLLDELDQMAVSHPAVLYNFFNWTTLENSKLIVVALANGLNLPETVLTNKTSSRLGIQRLQFPGYTDVELAAIIKSKFELLAQSGVVLKDDAIKFASKKIAGVSGDARRALKIVQRAVQIAKKGNEDKTTDIVVGAVHINRAILETTSSPVANFISDLPFVSKLLLIALLSKKRKSGLAENSLGDVLDEMKQIISTSSAKDSSKFIVEGQSMLEILYQDCIVRPKGFEYVWNELMESGLVLQNNKKTDRNAMVKLSVADEEITSVFKNDQGLKYFADLA